MSLDKIESLTIIIPLYNQEKYIKECLDSVAEILNLNVQLIIIDDASRDGSAKIVDEWISSSICLSSKLEIMFIKNHTNLGVCKTLNKGVAAARYDIIALCAADDFFLSNSLSKKVSTLKNSEYDAILSDVYIVDENSQVIMEKAYQSYFHANPKALRNESFLVGEIITNWCVPGPSLLIKKKTYALIGHYDPALIAEDRDFYLRLFHNCRVGFDFEPIAAYRMHSTNISKKSDFRKKMNEEIRNINALHSSNWKGINKWFLSSYSLGKNQGNFLQKMSFHIGRLIRIILRLSFVIKVFVSHEK